MPRPQAKSQYTDKQYRSLYVILDPYSKRFFIDYTLTKNVRQLYVEHCLGNRMKTKTMVAELTEMRARPCCFKLSEMFCTKVEAYRAVIGWTKIFVEQGYINLDQGNIAEYIHDVFGEAKTIYDQNKNTDIKQNFNCNNCLFPIYKRQKCKLKVRDTDATN